jgi:nucleoid-associated protein YgaU
MARHPSGRDLAWKSHIGQRRHLDGRLHVVRTGESLWAIAAMQLHSDDPARIARYWHRIYIRNREAIGSDPDLIREGQVLRLPAETDS